MYIIVSLGLSPLDLLEFPAQMKLFGEEVGNLDPLLVTRELCAAIKIRKKVAWLEWLILEMCREVNLTNILSIGRDRHTNEVIIYCIIGYKYESNEFSIHIYGDRRIRILENSQIDDIRFKCTTITCGRLYQSELIFPERYVKRNG